MAIVSRKPAPFAITRSRLARKSPIIRSMKSEGVHSPPVLAGNSLRVAIRESVQKFLDLNIYTLFIFGSEASGVADRRSDIDIGILGPQPVSGAVMQQIRDDLETLRTLRPFDVVDFSRADESFKSEALEHAERL